MMPSLFLLDTNAVSAVMADHPKVQARLSLQPLQAVTSVIVQGEIRYALERLPAGKRRADLEAKAAAVLAVLPVEPVSSQVAEIYGTLRRQMELQGENPDDNDLWIAATALSIGATVVTNDHIFGRVPGLKVEDWTQ